MKVDAKGNVYVAQWSGWEGFENISRWKASTRLQYCRGQRHHQRCLREGEKDLYVTVVKDPNDPKAAGCIVKIPNVQ